MARVTKVVQEINQVLEEGDHVASFVANLYTSWRNNSQTWRSNMRELRNYIFQTDTTQTTNNKLPWKNKTSIPKICQIRDNLHANYMAALFPSDDWFRWMPETKDAANKKVAKTITAYMKQKIRESNFKQTVSEALYDYIDYGNAIGEVVWVSDIHNTGEQKIPVYVGPKLYRVSPFDCQFDVSASSFKDAAKITRSLVSMGSLKAEADKPGQEWAATALEKAKEFRGRMSMYGDSDLDKAEGLQIDGFGSLSTYLSSGMVELLEYEGDTYNSETQELQTGRKIIVMDRKYVVYDQPMDSWLGKSNKEHVGWRYRPDNLMAMGPLDNLVGMQYRLDHLENLKADVFDQIAHPMFIIYGMVEDFEPGPDERIYANEDARVDVVRPDATALNADFQMDRLMNQMEELVGAPRQAMGIRTPGEKTAFEVQALENAAGRIFQQKIINFEERFIEPLLNQMLAAARQNVNAAEIVAIKDEDFGLEEFLSIDPKMLSQRGKLHPIGARHFARQAQLIQNLTGFVNSAAYQDGSVQAHVSGKKIAEIYEELLGLESFDLVKDNIRIIEQAETMSAQTMAQQGVAEEVADRQAVNNLEAEEALAASTEVV